MIWLSFRQLASLGRFRRVLAILFRSAVMISIIAAIAGVQLVWKTERLTVLYLLDQSESIPAERRRQMLDFAIQSVAQHRDRNREDLAGVIVFGREASIEIPPFADDLPPLGQVVSDFGATDATNLQAALKLALAAMPGETHRRIVIMTDGNETVGTASTIAAQIGAAGIGIDVVPVPLDSTADVLVEKIDLPADIRKGQPFEARVVMTHYPLPGDERSVRGRLSVTRSVGGDDQLLLDEPIELQPGKNVIPLRHQIDEPAAYTYEARFTPDSEADDALRQNNRTVAYTYVRGKGRVLLIEPWDSPGQYRLMIEQLRKADIEVVVQASNALFSSLAELQAYDAVILAGIPRTSGESGETLTSFSDSQIEMLVRNSQQLGAGLLMIGGPEALGAGGWAQTPLEAAMPVDFEIKNSKVTAVGALMLVIDSSGSMDGEKMTLCKAAAKEAVKALKEIDSIGVMTFDSVTQEIVPLQPVAGRTHILPMISRISAGGGTDMFPAMEQGFRELRKANASVKHMIVLTDGITQANDFRGLTRQIKDDGITITSVAVGADADVQLMRDIASVGGGKLYHVLSPKAVPQILMREARRVARALVFEDPSGFSPLVTLPHSVLSGIESSLPPLTGFVMTTPKTNPLVQTVLASPVPKGQENPVLSMWQYGLGRTAVLTTDTGERWATAWTQWPGQEKLIAQLVRWLMRPSGDMGKYSLATAVRDGEVQVVVTALDNDDAFLDFLQLNAAVLDPEMKPLPLQLRQTAPGRYVGSFAAEKTGSYFLSVLTSANSSPLSAGVTIPYSDEYRLREWNLPLIESLAANKPDGGQAGVVAPPLDRDVAGLVDVTNPFRGGLTSTGAIQDVWPWFVLIGCGLFLGDVFIRRVSIGTRWITTAWASVVRRGEQTEEVIMRLDSLMKAKQRIRGDTASIAPAENAVGDAAASSSRYDPVTFRGDPPAGADPSRKAIDRASNTTTGGIRPESPEAKSYTERLLEAKRRAQSP